MLNVLLGFLYAFLAALAFSLLASFFVCCGADPGLRTSSDIAAPLFGLLLGAYFSSRTTSWRVGLYVGIVYVVLWIEFWMYLIARLNPLLWVEDGLTHLTPAHAIWWGAAIITGAVGGLVGRSKLSWMPFFLLVLLGYIGAIFVISHQNDSGIISSEGTLPGYQIERQGPAADGTVFYLLTFDFERTLFNVGLYDCDSDDTKPRDDSNFSYLGQNLPGLVNKLSHRIAANRHQLLCTINGGFFGASGLSVAHHEEPIIQNGQLFYNVDLLKPKDQAWFLTINSLAGRPRFEMTPSIDGNNFNSYQTVLGGVRPLRVDGKSVALKPGAGATSLRCSRTSIGWSADGSKFYILIVHDPDGEGASQIQRKLNQPQTGGWDVSEVQKYWEQKQVPYALLFDGGESTQLAYRGDDAFHYVASGYQYSFTVGYLFQRPLLLTPPILPPDEAHRGVLNYLFVEAPEDRIHL